MEAVHVLEKLNAIQFLWKLNNNNIELIDSETDLNNYVKHIPLRFWDPIGHGLIFSWELQDLSDIEGPLVNQELDLQQVLYVYRYLSEQHNIDTVELTNEGIEFTIPSLTLSPLNEARNQPNGSLNIFPSELISILQFRGNSLLIPICCMELFYDSCYEIFPLYSPINFKDRLGRYLNSLYSNLSWKNRRRSSEVMPRAVG